MPNRLHEGMEPKEKKKNRPVVKGRRSPAITAMVNWEEVFRNDMMLGDVLVLLADGEVWEGTLVKDRQGNMKTLNGKKKQILTGLKKDFGRDLEGMARTWRAMISNAKTGYEMMGIHHLKQLGAP